MWTYIANWLTPTSLFLFINLMIGAIVLTSRFSSHKKQPQLQEHHHHQLVRAPSLLDRVRSFNLSHYKFPTPASETETAPATIDDHFFHNSNEPTTTGLDQHHPPLERAPSLLERVKSINFSSFYRSGVPEPGAAAEPDSDPYHVPASALVADHQVKRSKSESEAGPSRHPEAVSKMTKSASEKTVGGADKEEQEERERVERRRPATVRLEKTLSIEDDHGVDSKADDFINRFKQQLKLQRLDSLLRYKEMLKGKQKD